MKGGSGVRKRGPSAGAVEEAQHLGEKTENYDRMYLPGDAIVINEGVPGYEDLQRILKLAYEQAAIGKGKDRHGVKGEVWSNQPIIRIQKAFGPGFVLGQAAKKMEEAQYLDVEAAKFELLGAIVYVAAAYRFFEVKDDALCEER